MGVMMGLNEESKHGLTWEDLNPILSPEDIQKKIANFSLDFGYGQKQFLVKHQYYNGRSSFGIGYVGQIPKALLNPVNMTIHRETLTMGSFPISGYYYCSEAYKGNILSQIVKRLYASDKRGPEILLNSAHSYKEMSVEMCASFIKCFREQIVFFTGAGISAAVVPDWQSLQDILGYSNDRDEITNFIEIVKKVDRDPQTYLENVDKVHQAFILGQPTAAHWALKQLTQFTRTVLVSDNIDLLQQHTGLDVLRVHNLEPFYDDSDEKKITVQPQSIKAVVCIGMGGDRRGFLHWYKQQTQGFGTIIAINLEPPSFLSAEDYFVQGDAQTNLPELAKLIYS
ncbi:MAG: hypothetical protein K0S74_545 [Chlamydiales bacterium]|jgi:NAD-dependent SIR2 family protein deacetylase|nr:hypothetical protein [Chlamydiales bacterium]